MCLFQTNLIRGKRRRRIQSCCMSPLKLVAANKCCSESGRVITSLRHWAVSHMQAFDSSLFFYSNPWPSILPHSRSPPDKLRLSQRDPGSVCDPVDICCLLHMWLDLTQAHRWEREIPGGNRHIFAADPLGGTNLGTAVKALSLREKLMYWYFNLLEFTIID